MRPYFLVLLSFILFPLLSSCSTPLFPEKHYTYVSPKNPAVKTCIGRCQSARNYCQSICELKHAKCVQRARDLALYQLTREEKELQKKGISLSSVAKARRLKVLDKSYSCHHGCHCVSAYNTCYRACGGQVFER